MDPFQFIQFALWFLIPGAFALHSLNKNREEKVAWGDCFLRAFTKGIKVFLMQAVVACVIGGIVYLYHYTVYN